MPYRCRYIPIRIRKCARHLGSEVFLVDIDKFGSHSSALSLHVFRCFSTRSSCRVSVRYIYALNSNRNRNGANSLNFRLGVFHAHSPTHQAHTHKRRVEYCFQDTELNIFRACCDLPRNSQTQRGVSVTKCVVRSGSVFLISPSLNPKIRESAVAVWVRAVKDTDTDTDTDLWPHVCLLAGKTCICSEVLSNIEFWSEKSNNWSGF